MSVTKLYNQCSFTIEWTQIFDHWESRNNDCQVIDCTHSGKEGGWCDCEYISLTLQSCQSITAAFK